MDDFRGVAGTAAGTVGADSRRRKMRRYRKRTLKRYRRA